MNLSDRQFEALQSRVAPGEKQQAMVDDIVALGAAVGAVAGPLLTFVAAIPQALALSLRSLGTFAYAVLASAALPAGMVLCVADKA